MDNRNVHHVDHNEREDLLHTDTVVADASDAGVQPAGYEQSLNPTGEVPAADEQGDTSQLPTEDAGPIADRTGRDPSNLGDDIPSAGDVVHPGPVNVPVGKTPGM
jgi:hypothetical protein